MWSITVTRGDNGFVCEWNEHKAEGWPERKFYVCEEQDKMNGDVDAFRSLAYFLAEYFNCLGNKHSGKLRIEIDRRQDDNIPGQEPQPL